MISTARPTKPRLMDRLEEFEYSFQTKEPRIHAFVPEEDRFKRLKSEADSLRRKAYKPGSRPSLYGLLLGVKDIFHVDGFETHAGSYLPARELKGEQAETITKLRQAGMLVAGKTVTTEFAYFAPGPTRNPNNTEHTPGGSSSGSAAAVAAGLIDLALGTQTIGSIIRPASFCGVVGFKPSFGRVSTAGVIPLAPALDHVGLFSHYIEVLARVLPLLVSQWKPVTVLSNKPLLAIPVGEYLDQSDPDMQDHFWLTIERLKSKGYRFKEIDPFKDFKNILDRNGIILAAQAAHVHSAWYSVYKHLYHPRTAELIEKGLQISDTSLAQALFEQGQFRLDISTLMDIHGISAWISPAARGAAPRGIASTGDPIMNLPWTQAGFPTICLPSGMNSEGLPLGLQITGEFDRDEELIAFASEIENALAVTA